MCLLFQRQTNSEQFVIFLWDLIMINDRPFMLGRLKVEKPLGKKPESAPTFGTSRRDFWKN